MAGAVGILTRMFGTAISGAAGFAAGTALGPVLGPVVQLLRNDVNAQYPYVPPDPVTLAEGVAQGQVDELQARAWAAMHGVGDNAFTALVDIANTGPQLGYAYQAWRRGTLTDGEFRTALKRTGLETQWDSAMEDLKHDRLPLGAIATAVHRGIMVDAGLLVTGVPTGPGNVPRIPVSSLDTLAEFAAHGIDPERARVLVADTGLPLALGEMLSLLRRGVVTETDVRVSIAESNVRNEYMDVALALARRLLTPHEYAEAELRGVLTHQEAKDGAALSGIDPDIDYPTLFAIMGRPLAEHQITTGLARGGIYGGTYDDVPAGPYRDSIRRSAIRPEYASLAYANRFSYPSLFQLARLVASKTIDADTAADWAHKSGEAPEVVAALHKEWTTGTATTDPHVKKAQGTLWTEAHKAYVKNGISVAQVTPAFAALNIPADAQLEIVSLWDVEKTLASDVPPAA